MAPLTDEEKEYYENQKTCYICQKRFCYDKKKNRFINYIKKLEIIVILQENLETLLMAFVI